MLIQSIQYKDQPFKVALPDGWRVVITNLELVDELRKASEDTLSLHEAINEVSSR